MTEQHTAETDTPVRVGFRYKDGEVLSPELEAKSEDEELPVAVIDLGDGEWLTLSELRDLHSERLEATLDAWEDDDSEDENCQHEWELRSEHDTWVCAWCQAETTTPEVSA